MLKRVKTIRHHIGFRLLHWIIFIEGVLLTLTGLQIGGFFGLRVLTDTTSATHIVTGLALIVTLGVFVYYLIIDRDYKWYGLSRIPYSIKFFIAEFKAWFGIGPHVKEPIRYDPKKGEYVEKVVPTVVIVWWTYVIIGLVIIITGLAMAFPTQFSAIYSLADAIGYPIAGVGGYAFIRAIHRLFMFLLVGVVILHAYAAWVFKALRSITLGDREEPIVE
jgi:formate dehydrogenase subunit gamma